MDEVKISGTVKVLKAIRDSNLYKEYKEFIIVDNKQKYSKERRQIPTRDYLIEKLGLKKSRVQKLIKDLKDEGYIKEVGSFVGDGVRRFYYDITMKSRLLIKSSESK